MDAGDVPPVASVPWAPAVGLLCVLLALAVPPLAGAASASAAPAGVAAPASATSNEGEFLTRLNLERQARRLPLLVSDPELAPTSRSWSCHMASRGVLSHDPNLAQVAAQVEPAWRGVAENVGVGYSVKQLHDAFMGSTGHRNNMLNASYNRVGIGVVQSGGKIWVTVRFLAGPAIAGSTGLGPPPPPPGVPTVVTGDFNGDGNEDFLTYGPGSQADELWFGRDNRSLVRIVHRRERPLPPGGRRLRRRRRDRDPLVRPRCDGRSLVELERLRLVGDQPAGPTGPIALRGRLRRRRRRTTSSGTAPAPLGTAGGTGGSAVGSRRPPPR